MNVIVQRCGLCVTPSLHYLWCMYVCMYVKCWHAGVTSGFHEGLSGLRAAKYSTEGIKGNLLIREKRVNLRSCDCMWRLALSAGPSESLQGEHKQTGSGGLTQAHTHIQTLTKKHQNTHNTIWRSSVKLHYTNPSVCAVTT